MDKYSSQSLRRVWGHKAQGSLKDEGMGHLPSKPLRPTEVLAEGEGSASREVYLRKEATIRNIAYKTHYRHIYIVPHAIYIKYIRYMRYIANRICLI